MSNTKPSVDTTSLRALARLAPPDATHPERVAAVFPLIQAVPALCDALDEALREADRVDVERVEEHDRAEKAERERDGARAEVERLNVELSRLRAEVERLTQLGFVSVAQTSEALKVAHELHAQLDRSQAQCSQAIAFAAAALRGGA